MRKRLCLIVGPVALAATVLVPSGATAAGTCSTNKIYCPAKRVAPTGFTARTTPARDRRFPYTFVTTGELGVPRSIGNRVGCAGKATVTYKVRKVTISNRIAFMRFRNGACRYRSKVTFAWRQRIKLLGGTPLRATVIVRFLGNKYLQSVTHKRYSVILG
jgi:hypothetical protein